MQATSSANIKSEPPTIPDADFMSDLEGSTGGGNAETFPKGQLRVSGSRLEEQSATAFQVTAEQHELILSMLPFVKTVVGRVAISLPSHISHDDLLSAGVIGLMDAVRRFDASKGASIKNYIAMRVRGAVLDELRKMDWSPRSVHRKAREFRKVQENLEQRLGRRATESELAQEMKLSPEAFDQLLDSIRPSTFISLEDVRSGQSRGDGDLSQAECIADPNMVSPSERMSKEEQQDLIEDGIKLLSPVEQKVLALYYHEGLRLKEIALILEVTESRVSQVHTMAIHRLRSRLNRILD